MAEFSVTIEQLNSIKEQLRELNAQFNTEREQLSETAATLNGMWEGEAKEKFTAEIAKDQVQMQNFYNAVLAYVNTLEEIIQRYITAENTNLETVTTRVY